jgi:hypothetical protein
VDHARRSYSWEELVPDRRTFNAGLALAGLSGLPGCTGAEDEYLAVSRQLWRHGPLQGLSGRALGLELLRYASLAPSSHNTQCWRFELGAEAITVLPDFDRRCPVVDPDDHHLYVSLGCAAENLIQAAAALGLRAEPEFDAARKALRIGLQAAPARPTELFQAIPQRQSTRAEYDGQALSPTELARLEAAARSEQVRLLLLTDKPALETVLDFVVQGNTLQMNDPAFMAELRQWIRFNAREALRQGDGLLSLCSGNPELPSWLGPRLFDLVVRAGSENDKYRRQLRSSAGVAVFVAAREDVEHWMAVGRAYERFALQACAMGVRCAHLNMPVEVASLRPAFGAALGLGAQRADLVIRFGRGLLLPPSPRRPVSALLA